MTEELRREDRAILAAIDRLHSESGESEGAGEPLVREYTELLALLPYELEPVAPRPGLKHEILSQLGASSAARPHRKVDDLTLVQSGRGGEAPVPSKGGTDVTLIRFPARGTAPPPPPPAPATGWRFGRMALPLAAVLAFCLVGLGYLGGLFQEQQTRIAALESQLEEAHGLSGDLARLQERFEMVTTTARTAYPMRPTRHRSGEKCSGTVFVCGEHQQWYLSVRDVDPAPEGREYHLWFVTEDGMIDAGRVEIEGTSGMANAPSMPEGTRGFALSLDPPGPRTRPEEVVLRGETPLSL